MHIAREVYAADDDLASVRHSLPLAARFFALTKRRGEHLLWAGCRHPSGCGRFWLGASEGRWTSPRRASWAIAHGLLGRGQRVWRRLDVCDEPECVAPGHLTLLSPTAQRPPRARQVRPPLAPEVVVRIAGSVQTGAVVNLERSEGSSSERVRQPNTSPGLGVARLAVVRRLLHDRCRGAASFNVRRRTFARLPPIGWSHPNFMYDLLRLTQQRPRPGRTLTTKSPDFLG